MLNSRCLLIASFFAAQLQWNMDAIQSQEPLREKIMVRSSIDGTEQPSYLTLPGQVTERKPDNTAQQPKLTPIVVSLHSWSADLEQRQPELERLLHDRKWICLQANFRAIINQPAAWASTLASPSTPAGSSP